MKESQDIRVGTSGWTYDDWNGPFYPPEVKGAERLALYAEKFDTVELNASFYCTPSQAMIDAWNRRLAAERFHLVVKGPRTVTHLKKLRGCDEPLQSFLDRVSQLRALRVILWQLPPSLHKDCRRLDDFLHSLPKNIRHAVEFRHESWWDDEVVELLVRHKVAFTAVSHPQLPQTIHATADFLYVRFHGLGRELYRYEYSSEELAAWVQRLRQHLVGRGLYAFFNNDFNANAPKNATFFQELMLAEP